MGLPEAGVQLVAEGLAQFTSDMGRANDAVASFGKAGQEHGSAFDKGFGEVVTGALRQIGAMGVTALAEAGKAVAGFVSDSIGLAGNFEAGMQEFQAVAGQSVDTKGLEQFRDIFINLGKELPVSTSDVQKAAVEMVKGGIDPAIIAAGGLKQNIQFAAAAMGGDLVQAATVSAKILGGWADSNATAQQKADFLTHSTDLLTKAANASSVDVHELSLGIFNAQGIARTAGVSFDDLTTTLAELAPRFASSSEAGNSLKNVISRLQPTTQPAIDAMTALGLITEDGSNKFYDAQGNFIGFQQASQLLQDSLQGLTKQQQQQVLQTIFGNDAMNAAAALAELGAAGYQTMADSLQQANGVAENAALKQQGFNTALENAKGSLEALQITVGSALLPVLTELLNNVIAPAVNTLTDMADAVFGNAEAFDRLSPAAQAVVNFIKQVVDAVGGVIDAFNDAGAGSSEFAESIGYLAQQFGLPANLIEKVIMAVQDLVDWFGKASNEADSLGGVVEDLSGIWQQAIGVVNNVIAGYEAIIQAVLPVVQQFIANHGTEIAAFFKTSYDQIIQIVRLALEVYDAIVPPILQAIASFIAAHGEEIQKILKGAWDAVSAIVGGALETLKTILKLALDVIHGNWDEAWKDIQHIAEVQWDSIKGAIKGALDAIAGFFDTSLDDILRLWENNWNQLWDIASKLADRMPEIGSYIVQGIEQGISDAWSGFLSWLEGKVSGIVQSFLDWIGAGSPAKEFMPVGQFAVQGIMQGFSDMWPGLLSLVGGLGDQLIGQVTNLGNSIQSAIAQAFGSTASIDRQIVQNLDKFKGVLPEYQKYVQGALKDAEQQARQMLDPQEGAKYFAMRSKQILEYEELRKKLSEAETQDDRQRLEQQMLLVNAAQHAEISQFEANAKATTNTTEKLLESLQALTTAQGVNAKGQAQGLPSILDNPIMALFGSLLGQLGNAGDIFNALFRDPAWSYNIQPPASPTQQGMSTAGTTYTSNQTLNMPIYTNQSPTVMQDSAAIAWAVIP